MEQQSEPNLVSKNILTSDLLPDESMLSPNARAIIHHQDEILELWKKYVRMRVTRSKDVTDPILVNTMPAFINNFAEAISPQYPRSNINDSNSLAFEHGGERARLTIYTPESIIIEYKCLRRAIFNVLSSNQVSLTENEAEIINSSIDDAMTNAAMGFSLVQTEIKEQFMATLTHDLRNPLNAANLAAEMILKNPKGNVELFAKKIMENHKRIDLMINHLLDSITLKSGIKLNLKLNLCDIYQIARDLINESESQHGLRFELIGEPVEGYWDQDALKRTVENLLSNATKYGDPGTKITVSINSSHGRMILRVHNIGPPIPRNEQEAIFQVYRRALKAKIENKKGWGLGLALVRGVAEAHGGSVGVDSSLERGTTFIIDIPVDARPFQNSPTSMD